MWYNAKEAHPLNDGFYLTYNSDRHSIGDGGYIVLYYSTKYKMFNVRNEFNSEEAEKYAIDTEYWMPLPRPPKCAKGEIKEVTDTLEIAKAEVEWCYPLNYAIALDKAVEYLKELSS